MIIDTRKNILIVGLGLIGGCYAKGLKRLNFKVSAIDTNSNSIKYALDNNIIDSGSTKLDEKLIGSADLVVFCLYPDTFRNWIKDNQHLLKSGCLITDVTGVKKSIVYEIQSMLRQDIEFVPAHPMAGREVYGVENSDERIFYNANFVITPTDKNTPEAIDVIKEFGLLLGFKNIRVISPEKHDEVIGFVSQLTHCIAISLMTCDDKEDLQDFTGDSFRDLTRIARINEDMWSKLFVENKEELVNQIDLFTSELNKLRNMIKDEDIDSMKKLMIKSTNKRKLFDKE